MHLTYERFNGHRRNHRAIIDRDTGKKVGYIQSGGEGLGGVGSIEVSLFGGKYAMNVNTAEECWGFVRGVEAVLNHAIAMATAIAHRQSAGLSGIDIEALTSVGRH